MALTVIKPSGIDTSGNYTVTGMNVSANISVANLSVTTSANLGAVGNVIITGGTAGQYLETNGSGVLTWSTVASGSTSNISNGNSNVSIATANGNVTIASAGNTTMTVTGTGANVTGTANVTGNLIGGGDLNISGNGLFGGNLTVNGTLTYINSTTLSISDPIINLQTGPNGAAPVANTGKDVGTALNYYDTSAKIAWMGWDVSNAEIAFGSNVGISSEVVTFTSLANIRSGNANLGNVVTANFFTGSGNQLSALTFGNITTFTTAGLTTDELYLQATTRLNVTASGASGYLFDQYGATLNPSLYVTSGQTLAFNLNVSGHPFLIQTSGSANYSTGLEYVDATGTVLTAASAQGQVSGTLYWKVPYGIVGNYKYQCSIHGGMNGNIVVTDANVSNITVGLATYATTANSVAGANVSGQVANALVTGTVYTNAQPNITSVGTLTTVSVSGNANVGNIGATSGVFTTVAGSLTTAAQSNITSTGTLSSLSVSGTSNLGAVGNVTITGGTNGYVLSTNGSGTLSWVAQSSGGGASISNGTSNVNIATSGGNVTTGVNGNANILVVTGTGANINGTLSVTGQSNLGAVGNVVITGGTANYVLKTDGAGNLSWTAPPSDANVTVDNFTGNGVQTIFTLSTTPTSINQTSVNYNGATVLRTAYTLANANITFSSAPANGSLLEITTINLTSGGGGGGITAQDLLSPFLLMGA